MTLLIATYPKFVNFHANKEQTKKLKCKKIP